MPPELPDNDPILLQVASLVDEHKEIKAQPLQIAILYRASEQKVVLFEVSENFGDNQVDVEGHLLQAWVAQTDDFRIGDDVDFYLVLTNPPEFDTALKNKWPEVLELRQSIEEGKARLMHGNPNTLDEILALSA